MDQSFSAFLYSTNRQRHDSYEALHIPYSYRCCCSSHSLYATSCGLCWAPINFSSRTSFIRIADCFLTIDEPPFISIQRTASPFQNPYKPAAPTSLVASVAADEVRSFCSMIPWNGLFVSHTQRLASSNTSRWTPLLPQHHWGRRYSQPTKRRRTWPPISFLSGLFSSPESLSVPHRPLLGSPPSTLPAASPCSCSAWALH